MPQEQHINDLRSEIEKHQKHPKISKNVLYLILGAFIIFLVAIGIYFSSNQNQIKLTITNGSELIKRLEVRAENAEKAQVEGRDSIQSLNQNIVDRELKLDSLKKVFEKEADKKDKSIKELNDKVDSLLRIVNTYQHSDIEPVKQRPN